MPHGPSLGHKAHHVFRLSVFRAAEYLGALPDPETIRVLEAMPAVGLDRHAAMIAVVACALDRLPADLIDRASDWVQPDDVATVFKGYRAGLQSKGLNLYDQSVHRVRVILWLAPRGKIESASRAIEGWKDDQLMQRLARTCVDMIECLSAANKAQVVRDVIRSGVAANHLAMYATRYSDGDILSVRRCLRDFLAAGDPECDRVILGDLEGWVSRLEGASTQLHPDFDYALTVLRGRARIQRQSDRMPMMAAP